MQSDKNNVQPCELNTSEERSLLPDIIKIVRSYLLKYENAVIDGSTNYLVECAKDGWVSGFKLQDYGDVEKAIGVAITNGHVELVQYMLDTSFIDSDIVDCIGVAAQSGQLIIIDMLIPIIYRTPLELAVKNGHYDMVVKLLRLTKPTSYMTLIAARIGRPDIFNLLMPYTDPNLQQLNHAVYQGGSIALIRKYGTSIKDQHLWTIDKHPHLINYVLQRGWDPNVILQNIKIQPVGNLKSLAITLAFKPVYDLTPAKDPICQRVLSFL